jgi:DNA/RNA-binding domain of Phe-tRNA-synthetase-like protein
MLTVAPHPLLHPRALACTLAAPLGQLPSPPWLEALLRPDAQAPLRPDEATRTAIRDLLRHGGYKPTGRGKPSSEYLVRASGDGTLGSINLLVDVCNAVSLHSGLPISVVDLERTEPPLRLGVAAAGETYVFNASGQTIDLAGLLCLFDAQGACANAVKDSQRTKTHPGTRRALSVLWAAKGLEGRAELATSWYQELLDRAGAAVEQVR